jgi:hypothetical protein
MRQLFRGRSRAILAVLALAVAPLVGLVGQTPASAATVQPYGLYQSGNNLNYTIGTSTEYAGAIQYYGWSEDPQSTEISALPTTVTPFLEMQTCGNPCDTATSIPLTSITDGSYDTYLTTFASDIASLGRHVFLTWERDRRWHQHGRYGGRLDHHVELRHQEDRRQRHGEVADHLDLGSEHRARWLGCIRVLDQRRSYRRERRSCRTRRLLRQHGHNLGKPIRIQLHRCGEGQRQQVPVLRHRDRHPAG